LVFLIHTELLCTVNHTSDLHDSTNRTQLINYEKFGIQNKFVRWKWERQTIRCKSKEIRYLVLRQGDALFTLLFNLCMEKVIWNVKTNPGGYNSVQKAMPHIRRWWGSFGTCSQIHCRNSRRFDTASHIILTISASSITYPINRKKNNDVAEGNEIDRNRQM